MVAEWFDVVDFWPTPDPNVMDSFILRRSCDKKTSMKNPFFCNVHVIKVKQTYYTLTVDIKTLFI